MITFARLSIDESGAIASVGRKYLGKRDANDAYVFIFDLKKRLANRVQLTSDGGAFLNQ